MATQRYLVLSALSGCLWAAIALLLGAEAMGPIIWGGVVASPLIGVIAAYIFLPACRWPLVARIVFALVTLYLAVAAFGLAAGLYDAVVRDIPNRIGWAVVVQAMLASLWGITFTGLVLILWPLSFVNHSFVCRWGRVTYPERFTTENTEGTETKKY